MRALTIAVVVLVVSSTVAIGVLAGAGTGLIVSGGDDDGIDDGTGVAAAQPEVPDPDPDEDDADAEEEDDDEDSEADDEDDEGDGDTEADDEEDEDDDDITTIDLDDEDDEDDEDAADGEDEDEGDEEDSAGPGTDPGTGPSEDDEDEEADDDETTSPSAGPSPGADEDDDAEADEDDEDEEAEEADADDDETVSPSPEATEDEDDDDDGNIVTDNLPEWDPGSWTAGTLEYLLDVAAAAYVFLIDDVVNELLGTPRPVNDGASGVFGYPVEDSDVPSSVAYYQLFHDFFIPSVMPLVGGIIGFVLLGTLIGPPLAVLGRGSARSVFVGVLTLAFVLIVYWDFISFLHHASHWITQWFLPEGEEIVEDSVDGAAGPLGALVGMTIFGVTKGVILVLMQGVRWALLMVAPFALPFLLVGAYAGYFSTVKMISSFFIWQYYGLLVMNWPTAFLLRIAAEVDFEGTFDLPAESAADEVFVETVVATMTLAVTMGIWIAAMAIPFLIMGSFGLASILGRGLFVTKLGQFPPGGGPPGGGGGPPPPPGGGGGAARIPRKAAMGAGSTPGYGSTGSLSSPAARANLLGARKDGGWTSRTLANKTSSSTATAKSGGSGGGALSRSDGSSRRRGGRGRGRNRSRRDPDELDNITESRRGGIDERRKAAHEKTRAQNHSESQSPSAHSRRQSRYGASDSD